MRKLNRIIPNYPAITILLVVLLYSTSVHCNAYNHACNPNAKSVKWLTGFDKTVELSRKNFGIMAVLITMDGNICPKCKKLLKTKLTKDVVTLMNCQFYSTQLFIQVINPNSNRHSIKVNDESLLTLGGTEYLNPLDAINNYFNIKIYENGIITPRPHMILLKPSESPQLKEKIDLTSKVNIANILNKYS